MKLLLDTHAFIWWDSAPERLSSSAVALIRDPTNEVWLSTVSVWEMQIKSQLQKLSLRQPLRTIVEQQQTNGLRVLDLCLEHVLAVEQLPPVHKDPFDRLLAAQAIAESASLLTADPAFAGYPVRIVW